MKNAGFTVIELLVIMGVFALLVGFATINLFNVKAQASLSTSANILVSDLKTQQIKAMSGDANGGLSNINYSVHFAGMSYVLLPQNISISLGDFVSVGVLPDLVFAKGSGETGVSNYQIILTNSASSQTKKITVNRLGVANVQ